MSALRDFLYRLTAIFRRKQLDREMAEEMRFHLNQRTADFAADGLASEEARFAAQRKFGNAGLLQEQSRDARGFMWLDQFQQDLRYGLRQLRRNPAFTAVVVVSLALGIGANTALFSLVDEVLLRPLSVKNPHELFILRWSSLPDGLYTSRDGRSTTDPTNGRTTSTSLSYFIFERLRDRPGPFSEVFAFAEIQQLNVGLDHNAEIARGQLATGGYFPGLGLSAVRGRLFDASDDRPGAAPVAVLSWGYWQRHFGGADSAVGQVIQVNGVAVTVVGVTPRDFNGTLQIDSSPDLTLPMALTPQVSGGRSPLTENTFWWLQIMGRLRPGITPAAAQAELEPAFIQAARDGWLTGKTGQSLAGHADPKLILESGAQGQTEGRRDYAESLHLLMGIVGFVLVIACMNVANLLLARGSQRAREIGVRLSLGASRARLIRQLLLESLLLSVLGGCLGLLVAWWGRSALLQLRPVGSAGALELNFTILGFTLGICLLTGLAFGLVPAWQATRLDLNSALKSGSGAAGRFGLRRVLMIAQVALSVVLLVGAGLFLRTLHNLRSADTGFNRENVLLFRVDATLSGYRGAAIATLFDRLLDRFARVPGVQSAAFSRHPLLSGSRRSAPVTVPGSATTPPNPGTNVQLVSPSFFATMQIPLLLGRNFDDRDNDTSPRVLVVNEAFVKKFLPGEQPLGRTVRMREKTFEIVGVVRDARYYSLRDDMPVTIYQAFRQEVSGQANFAVRTIGSPETVAASIRSAVREVDDNLPLFDLRTQEEQVTQLVAQERTFALLSAFFGALALVLTCVGLYGLLAHQVTARTREIGIRMALGAQLRAVVGLVLTEGLCLAVIGVILGFGAATGLAGFTARLLYGVPATDLATLAAVAATLLTVALVASLIPARRAAKVDPMVALRTE